VLNVWTFETPVTGGTPVTVPLVPTYVAFVKDWLLKIVRVAAAIY
jgi:hypothetical protein